MTAQTPMSLFIILNMLYITHYVHVQKKKQMPVSVMYLSITFMQNSHHAKFLFMDSAAEVALPGRRPPGRHSAAACGPGAEHIHRRLPQLPRRRLVHTRRPGLLPAGRALPRFLGEPRDKALRPAALRERHSGAHGRADEAAMHLKRTHSAALTVRRVHACSEECICTV